jgi:transposase-like protein
MAPDQRGQVGDVVVVDSRTSRCTGTGAMYRAIDRNGALVDVMFSEHRDMVLSQFVPASVA